MEIDCQFLPSVWSGLFSEEYKAQDFSDQPSDSRSYILWNIPLQSIPYALSQINDKAHIELCEPESHHSIPNKRQKSEKQAGAMSPSPCSLLQPGGRALCLGSCLWGSNLCRCWTTLPWQKKLLMHTPGGIWVHSAALSFLWRQGKFRLSKAIKLRQKQLFASQGQNSQQAFIGMIDYSA